MIDLLTFSNALAANIATATGVDTITEGDTATYTGEFSDILILSTTSTDEALPANATQRLTYRLGYVYQPDTMTAATLEAKRAAIFQAVGEMVAGIERYSELAGAVILDAQIQPWEVSYNGPAVNFNIPLEFVA